MNLERNNLLLMDDNDISQIGCNSTWGFGNQLFVFAKPNIERVVDKEAKCSTIFEVKWDTEMYQPIFRKLISESKVIFLNIQHFVIENTNPFTETKIQLSNHSREYRSVLKECAYELHSQLSTEGNDNDLLRNQKEILEMFEILWSLFELLFIDSNPSSYIMKPLMEWFSLRFYEHDDVAEKVIRSQEREKHPQYWISVKCLLLYGRVEDARKMLSLHNNAKSELYRRFIKLLELMPIYNSKHQSYSEFCIKWHQWHDLTASHLHDAIFSVDQNLQDICKIICGEEDVFVECKDLVQTWYGMFVSRLFYQQPMVTSSDLHFHAKYCLDQFTNISQFDNIVLGLFSLDAQKAIHLASSYFNNWWFVSHITDLLTHLNVFPDKKLKFGSNLREFLLLEYSTSLLSNDSLWQHGIDYLSHCSVFGRDYIANHLLRVSCDTEFKVRKVLRLCDLYELPNHGTLRKREMAVKALKNNHLGNALMWSTKAEDIQLSNEIVESICDGYIKMGRFVGSNVLDNMGPAMQLSNHVAFLGKFYEYEELHSKGLYNEATSLLLLLLTEGNAPKKYWRLLFSSLLMIFENNLVCLENSQICNFMDRLNKFEIWKSLNKVGMEEDSEKMRMLRMHLAHHLSKTLIIPAN